MLPTQILPLPEDIQEGFYAHSLAHNGVSSSGSEPHGTAAASQDEEPTSGRLEGSAGSSAGRSSLRGGPEQAEVEPKQAQAQGLTFEAGEDTLESLQALLAQRRAELGALGSFSGQLGSGGQPVSAPAAAPALAPGSAAPGTAHAVDGTTGAPGEGGDVAEAGGLRAPNGHAAQEMPRQGSAAGPPLTCGGGAQ